MALGWLSVPTVLSILLIILEILQLISAFI